MPRTALAVTRLTLSLDPLRDPKYALLSLDSQALAVALGSNLPEQKKTLEWFVALVESPAIELCYEEDDTKYRGKLRDLPNIAYSYALALFILARAASLVVDESSQATNLRELSNAALQEAITRFPTIVPQLLEKLEVDTTGRSFQRDWLTVMDYASDRCETVNNAWFAEAPDYFLMTRLAQSIEKISTIFVMQSAAHWSDEHVLQWLFDNLQILSSSGADAIVELPSFALLRYTGVKTSWYNTRIDLLPEDANLLDPNIVAHAMAVQPGRPRFLRNQHVFDQQLNAAAANNGRPRFLGPPTQVVDPDWPLVEVFWRSFLPWNRVEGVPSAPRR